MLCVSLDADDCDRIIDGTVVMVALDCLVLFSCFVL